mmetsp:Transcript_10168/g.15508  ORF Transcript_10168/g.15508 Transcript_10168/m.15508 type:complete len:153 (+) Transcript_10168:476-934(+)
MNCKEDAMTDNFMKLFISEIVLRYAYYSYWIFHWRMKAKAGLDDFQQDFELSDEIVWFFTFQVILWQCQLVYPVMSWVAVFVMYFHTRYLIYRLKYQKRQPAVASNSMETGNTMNKYLFYTFLVVFVFYSAVLFIPKARFNFFNTDISDYDS